MARFQVRVELRKPEKDSYEKLHREMEDAGFTRRITSFEGVVYHLPHAEYRAETTDTAEAVREVARGRALKAHPTHNPMVLVTPTDGCVWIGLDPA